MEPSHVTDAFDAAWQGPAVGLLDLDAFFASVEQLDHPEWRGRPVIVGGSPDRRGVVSTASYEARRYGVHSAMPSSQARRLCPDAVWAAPRHGRYREVSDRVMRFLKDETPYVEQVSIDEAFFDVTPGPHAAEGPVEVCRRVQAEVAGLGVTCSIGLGVSKTVAKIASERDKPRGLTVVAPGSEGDFLAPLPVRAMSGVGPASERRLARLGIRTLGDLAQADPERLAAAFGVTGPRLVARARGLPDSPVRAYADAEAPKSVSHERTYERDLTTQDDVRAAVLSMAQMVGAHLRRRGLSGTTVTLKLRTADLAYHTAQRTLARPTNDEAEFGQVALELLREVWGEGTPLRLVGVGVSGFGGGRGEQLSLFDGEAAHVDPAHDRAGLSRATDAIRERFGDDAIAFGRDLRLRGKTTGTPPS